MKVLVTGTGRCGTAWIAAACRAAGLDQVGHEQVFTPRAVHQRAWGRLDVESSCFAAPHLPVDVPVLHLVRHPELVARSIARTPFWSMPDIHRDYWLGHGFEPCGEPLVDGFRFWTWVNRLITPHATATMRIEDCHTFADVMAGLGCPLPSPDDINSVPTNVNSRGPTNGAKIPDHPVVAEAFDLASTYGYEAR